MQPCHHRKEFLRFMNQNKAEAYKKKKLKASELRSKTPPLSIAMEVEECEGKAGDIEFNPPLPAEDPPPPPPPAPQEPPPNKRVKELEDGEITDDSQESMDSLTVKKQKIMKELGGESTQKDTKPDANSSDGNRESQEESEDSQPSVISSTQAAQSENSCSGDGISEHKIKTKKHHRSHSKGFNLGTVIPESCTPFTSLPASEKWTVDVSEHIVFDNLPDALGTWDKMKGLMSACWTISCPSWHGSTRQTEERLASDAADKQMCMNIKGLKEQPKLVRLEKDKEELAVAKKIMSTVMKENAEAQEGREEIHRLMFPVLLQTLDTLVSA
ncbi:hypothetical protein GWK47_010339 [Chionoecetes opilio]|uniref:Uncharacterized protein n=1 Tax=Chionoecetes opilio TaxID=41210 RepID=A0A8J4Y4J5_CHIOP|nr:hypothetical protein GWK47_010339 [Chionoecetes opilio]